MTRAEILLWGACPFLVVTACGHDERATALAQRDVLAAPELDGHGRATVVPDVVTTAPDAVDSGATETVDEIVVVDTSSDTTPDEVATGPCGGPEDCPAPACWKPVCSDGVCGIEPDHGATCDDGDACTEKDRCVGGLCVGSAIVCQDDDPCTEDACAQDTGACVATPIPGCVTDAQCDGETPGTPCDDGRAETAADLCFTDVCAGFTTVRVEPDQVPDAIGLVITETDRSTRDPEEWSSAFWILEEDFQEAHVLAETDDPAAPVVATDTRQGAPFHGLMDGFTSDEDGYVWERDGDHWTFANPWDDAVDASGRGRGSGLFTAANRDGAREIWLVGEDHGDEWIRHCYEDDGETGCDWQELDDFDPSSLPSSIAGVARCDGGGPCDVHLALAADSFAGFGYYNDSYENADGAAELWDKGAVPSNAAQRQTRAIAGWASGDGVEFLVVGSGGLMLHRRADGDWSGHLTVREGQGARSFSGVVASDGLLAVIGTRRTGDQLVYELWTAASDADIEEPTAWQVHTLLSAQPADAAGLYDIAIAGSELRIVGAIRRPSPNALGLLDGLVLVRKR